MARYRLFRCYIPTVEMARVEEVWAVDICPLFSSNRPYYSVSAVAVVILVETKLIVADSGL